MLLDREFQERETDILGAFSEEAFALAAYSDRAKVAIEEIQFGLNNNDLAIMIGGGSKNPFDRGGLVIARASKIPAEQDQVKDRKSDVSGKSGTVRVDLGGRCVIKKKNTNRRK